MNYEDKRTAVLAEMASITSMEKGRLTAEYREVERDGKTVRLGPYHKHQRWEDGRNVSTRIPAKDAEVLKEAVEGYHRFQSLADAFIDVTIAMTRAQHKQDSKKKKRN